MEENGSGSGAGLALTSNGALIGDSGVTARSTMGQTPDDLLRKESKRVLV